MTYDPNQTHPGTTPFSSGGFGGGGHPPPQGSYIRLAPSADAVRDISAADLQVGDLILSTTTDADSAAIRRVTGSPVSHVALYIGNGEVIEAIGPGVTIHPLATALADDYYAAAYRKSGLNDSDRDRMVRWLRTQEGRPYDVGGLLGEYTNSDDAWFCSELVFAAFAHIGKPLSATPPHDAEPGHILTLSGVDYLGHLKRPGMAAAQSSGGNAGNDEPGRFAPTEADRDRMIPAGSYGQTYDAQHLEVGDMILTSADSAISEAIRQHTGQPGSHVALYVGDGMVVEAVADGVVQNTLSYTLGQTDFAAAYRIPGLSDAEKRQIKAFAMDAVARGVEYDFRAITTFQHWQDDERLFCSELVFEAFASAGRPLGNAHTSRPGDVITLTGVQYLGHLPARRDGHTSQTQTFRPAHPMSGGSNMEPAIQAAINAGASEAEARAYFGQAMGRSLSGSAITLPDVSFLSDSSALMAGVRTVVDAAFPADANPLNILFDFCTRYDLCLAIGLHGSVPSGFMSNAGISGGIVIAPHRRAGLYFSSSYGEGWVFDAAAGVQVIVVHGGESNFNGTSFVVGGSLDGSEGPGVGFRVILGTNGSPIGAVGEINFSLGIPVASAVEFTGAISQTTSWMTTLSVPMSTADHPKLAEAIRIAMEHGATEQEARAFFAGSATAMSMARPLSGGTIPPYTRVTGWRRYAVEQLIDLAVPGFGRGPLSASTMLATQARAQSVSIGIGVGINAGLGGSASGGVGAVFLPNGDLAIYGSWGIGGGWNFSINLTYDLTVINGDASVFFGESLVIGGSASIDFGVSVGGGSNLILPPGGGDPIGVIIQGSVGLGLPVISTFEGGIQRVETNAFSVPHASPMMIGGLPVYPASSRGLSAPNVIPFQRASRAMSASGDVDVKLRVFIPAPALDAPPTFLVVGENRYFSGDGRGFSYDQGTSRAEIHAKVRLTSDTRGTASLHNVDRHWGETKQYAAGDVTAVAGKPDWWFAPIGNPTPIDRATLAVTDSNLSIAAMRHTIDGAEDGASYGKVRMIVNGGIPLINAAAPNINADLKLELRRGASGTLMAHLHGEHDGFPAYEVYVDGQRIHHFDPVAQNQTPMSLGGLGDGEWSVNVPWRDVQGTSAAQALSAHGRPMPALRSTTWM